MKKVLIAHQSTIPHYRIPFYNSLNQNKNKEWCFDVVFDRKEIQKNRYFRDQLNLSDFNFSTLDVSTHALKLRNRIISYQSFWSEAGHYDLIIIEDAINNLTYPLCQLHRIKGKRVAHWGLGKDRKVEKHSPITYLVEKFKLSLDRNADGYFAYTEGVKKYLLTEGVPAERIFIVNNTVDIETHRASYNNQIQQRASIREELGVSEKKVLLFVSTFKKSKKVDYLMKAFAILRKLDPSFYLILVGSGGEQYLHGYDQRNVKYLGSIVDPIKLTPLYIAGDIFAYPGQVGLAPLQALCYDLPIITIDSPYLHGPEIEYLTPENSLILPASTTPEEFAYQIQKLFNNHEELESIRNSTWGSIQHLTIGKMAENFAFGIDQILGLKN